MSHVSKKKHLLHFFNFSFFSKFGGIVYIDNGNQLISIIQTSIYSCLADMVSLQFLKKFRNKIYLLQDGGAMYIGNNNSFIEVSDCQFLDVLAHGVSLSL